MSKSPDITGSKADASKTRDLFIDLINFILNLISLNNPGPINIESAQDISLLISSTWESINSPEPWSSTYLIIGSIKALSYSENLKPEILNIHKKYGVTECIKMKSSLKFCVIASGEYDLYVAEPRACEWDIAAGHAILKNAGGQITDFDGNEILYGKENFKNPSVILKRASIL